MNDYSDIFHMDATVWKNDLNISFCIKEENASDAKRGIWPKGKKLLFRTLSMKATFKSGAANSVRPFSTLQFTHATNSHMLVSKNIVGRIFALFICVIFHLF